MSDKSDIVKVSRVLFARSATRHRISKESIRFVIAHCGRRFDEGPSKRGGEPVDPRRLYLGDDAADAPLEVIAVEVFDGELLVIHAMALRKKYRQQYEEARQWRR